MCDAEHYLLDPVRRKLMAGALALPALLATHRTHAAEPLVQAPSGTYSGQLQDGVWAFRGVRYGVDTAHTRFQAPLAAPSSTQRIKAWGNGNIAPQRSNTIDTQSEDCLFLNLWTPAPDPRAKRAVMVYIHGGAYSNGSGNDPLTDGTQLAARGDVVVVTITHRLNAFGYLFLGRMDARLGEHLGARFPDSGNAGQLDLILALQWVRDNIAAFGGDASKVTVFGQSGGGAKIATLMATPAAQGLFQRAATMSGQQITASGPLNATRRAEAYLARLGLDASSAPVEKLIAALDTIDPIIGGSLYFGPVLDGHTLLRHPFYPDAAPQSLGLPLLLGNTIAETRAFFPPGHAKLNDLDWRNMTERIAPELRVDIAPELVVQNYRQWFPEKSPAEIFIAATTAGRSWRGQVIEAEERAKAGAPAFVYQLDFEQAMHTDDIGLVFGTQPGMTAMQRVMSERMMNVFIAFAKTGQPGWPAYELNERKTMIFDTVSRVENNPRQRERELFAAVPYIQPGT